MNSSSLIMETPGLADALKGTLIYLNILKNIFVYVIFTSHLCKHVISL